MAIHSGVTQLNTRAWSDRLAEADSSLRVHLIGIGGAGLSAIARTLLELGMRVSGSDLHASPATAQLTEMGAVVFASQAAKNLEALPLDELPDVVLISSAVKDDNEERLAAAGLGLPVVKRSQFLPALLRNRTVIAVAGAHGKSTTTSMIITVLKGAGFDPGFIVGANLPGIGSAAAGSDNYFVIEADEYDHMFLGLKPAIAVITNVEWDHPDCYPTPASFRKAFMQFVDQVDRNGLVVSCLDDVGAEQLRQNRYSRGPKWITYGLSQGADLRAELRPANESSNCADLYWWHAPSGCIQLSIPGAHSIRNALAAAVVGSWCGIPIDAAVESLMAYSGISRRFEYKGSANGVLIYDDYAHHPTEIEATLAAARQQYPQSRIWAIFQPHTFSRTEKMLYRMGDSFGDADQVIVTDIYAARESDDARVSARDLVSTSSHPTIRHIGSLEDAAQLLLAEAEPGDIVVTLGAGDVNTVGAKMLAATAQRSSGTST